MPAKLVAFRYHCSQNFIDDLNPDSVTIPFYLNEKTELNPKGVIVSSSIDISRSFRITSNEPYILESTCCQEFSHKVFKNIPP